ncbi:MAG: Gfo/Idh/MocA family oxidoreductase [Planctomycetes bacterium]|nr:Gfo/Idh/MocA family oxidoreductase [Planctomycetota bacterium]
MVKMGLVGAGTMGEMYCMAFTQCPLSELAAVCDLEEKKAGKLARKYHVPACYTDVNDMLAGADIDAVAIATPDFHHRTPAIACLRAGKDVLCEKPLATTMKDCRAIAAAVKASGRKFMVNYGNRHRPNARLIRDRVRSGEIGTVQNVFIRLREQLSKTKTLAWAATTTPTFFLLSHCADTVRWIIGGTATEAHARASYGVMEKRGLDTPDTVVAMLPFDNGAVVTMDASWIMPDGFEPSIDFRIEIIGTEGVIYADLYPRDLLLYGRKAEGADHSSGAVDPMGRTLSWWFNSCYYFVECIEGNIIPEPSAEDGTEITRILLAIERSVRTGRTVPVR